MNCSNSLRPGRLAMTALALLVIALLAAPATAIGPGDLKKKAEKEAKKAAEKAAGQAPAAPADPTESGSEGAAPAAGSASSAGADGGKIAKVSTKFDFIPGDKVLFYDDFTKDEMGEFPMRWTLHNGTFEVAEMNGERWMRCTSTDSHIRPKLPPDMKVLPENWTLEFDFYADEYAGSALNVHALSADENQVWRVVFPMGPQLFLETGEIQSTTPLEEGVAPEGRHHIQFMARGKSLKV